MADAPKSAEQESIEWEAAAAGALGGQAPATDQKRIVLLRCRPGLLLGLGAVVAVLVLNSVGLILVTGALRKLRENAGAAPAPAAPGTGEPAAHDGAAPPAGDAKETAASAPETAPPPAKDSPSAIGDALAEPRRLLAEGDHRRVTEVLEQRMRSQKLSLSDRFEAALMLARSYRALGDQERAFTYARQAADEVVSDLPSAHLFRSAESLLQRGEFTGARKMFYALLARADALSKDEQFLVPLAEFHVADCFKGAAFASGGSP